MALCEQCGNFDDNEVENDYGIFHLGKRPKRRKGYPPALISTGTEILKRIMIWASMIAYVKSVLILITQRAKLN